MNKSAASKALKEGILPIFGIIGITIVLVAILAVCLYLGKGTESIIPVHVHEGETVDPSLPRFIFMSVAFVVALLLAGRADKTEKLFPAFWIGYTGGTLLWQSVGECSWHFGIPCEDYLICFPHLEAANSTLLVILFTLLLVYCYKRNAFSWGMWCYILSFTGNWFSHFFIIGTFPYAAAFMEEAQWYALAGGVLGGLITIAALALIFWRAGTTKSRLLCSLLLYFGIGMIVTGVGGV